jgi:DNA-binding response OmpR family regulator
MDRIKTRATDWDSPGIQDSTRLIVVEDDPELLSDIVDYFRHRGFAVRGVGDGAGLDAALDDEGADLVLLDVLLPGESGISIARRLARREGMGIVMLTCKGEADDQITGLEAGADVYLSKGTDLGVIEATLRSVLRRVKGADADSGQWQLDTLTWLLITPGGEKVSLTATEIGLLVPLCAAAGRTVDRATILTEIGKPDTESSRRNLEACVRRLKAKVEEAAGCSLPIKTAYGSGFAFTSRVDVT